jgi:TPR repeat protein
MTMSLSALITVALEAAGIAVVKGGATAAGSGAAKIVGRRVFKGKTRAAEDVMAMAIVRAIEESTLGYDDRSAEWWTRAGQRLIKPFVNKDVAGEVLRTVVAYPERTDDTRQTLIAALGTTGQDFYELARSLEFDAEQFLSAMPGIILDELITAAAEPNSPLLQLAHYATSRQIATQQVTAASATPEPGLLADLVEVVAGEQLPMVTELDPYRLGATPSPFGNTGSYGQFDPYVPRTRDNDLATALADAAERNRLVLLVGPSKSGKTRTAFEAIRTHSPQARLLFPRPGTFGRLAMDPRLRDSTDTVVVWLDDLDRYLTHADPLTPALLSRLTNRSGPTVVLATVRQEQRDRLRQSGELTRDPRVLLDHAIVIVLAPLTNENPNEEAAARLAYPGQELQFGLAAHLAGAPELTRRYDDARYTDPMQHAVIKVAIDWVRAGRPDPIPEASLTELALDAFESERPDLDGTDQEAAAAIKVARTPPEGLGRVAALITRRLPDGTRAYRPFDYLVAADDGQNHPPRPIPESFWKKVLKDADPEVALAVSLAAFQRNKIPLVIYASEQAAAAGQAHAMFGLGVMAAARKDLDAARLWYLRAAAAGDTDAMVNLGVLLAERSDPPDLEAARGWYEKAATAGDTDAMFNLGVLVADLQDPPDLEAARRWYEKAATAGNTNALVNLGAMADERNDLAAASAWYEKAADEGHTLAMVNLGMMLVQQNPPDLEAARRWYEKAATAGDTNAMVNLGALLAERSDPPDRPAARRWYEKAAEQGHTHAMVNLGMMLAEQNPPDLDAESAWYRTAADKGNTDAMFKLGVLLADRNDRPAARRWYEKAAEQGHTYAMVNLAILLADQGDLDSALGWAEKAAKAGDVYGMNHFGVMLAQQNPPDLDAASAWYEKAADEGDTDAMVNLGFLLAEVKDPKDLDAARRWYEKAADEGHVGAMFNLGFLFAERKSPPDLDAARRWYEKAATAGNSDAMFNLGVLLASRCNPPDIVAARAWLTRAAEAGHPLNAG